MGEGELVVEVLSAGIDGTDDKLVSGQYGPAPPGEDQLLTYRYENFGRVREAAGELHPAAARVWDSTSTAGQARPLHRVYLMNGFGG
jgi:threonine dehydrogenase-like Zn-dependent dehydrogenase